MNWENIKKGIEFENSNFFLPWNVRIDEIKEIGDPDIYYNGGRIEIFWENKILLDGIHGDWMTYRMEDEKRSKFKYIRLRYLGDKESEEAYEQLKKHFINKIGNPNLQEEEDPLEKKVEWVNGNCYIQIYLFEMHALRCNLTVGIR